MQRYPFGQLGGERDSYKPEKGHIPLRGLEKIADIGPGTHLCLLYRDEEERRAVLTEYVCQGFETGERVMCIVDASSAHQIREYLRGVGLDPQEAEHRGQLRFLTPDEAYLREGTFDPRGMIALLREETQEALTAGFTGLRVTGEMGWALQGLHGSERLIEYEALLNEFFPGSACTGLCQYDVHRFPPKILLDVLRTHPVVAVGTHFHENPFYIPPGEFLHGATDEAILARQLGILEERLALLNSIREQTKALTERVKELSCISRLRELAMREDLSVPEILEASLPIIRSGWRWPDLIQVRIEFEGKVFASAGFTESPWRKTAPLRRGGAEVGKVEVVYPDPPPEREPFLPEEEELLTNIVYHLNQLIEQRHDRDRLRYLNSILRAIRNVNQLLVREKDRDRLLQEICKVLVSTRGYFSAWIVLWGGDGNFVATAEAGLEQDFLPLLEQLQQGKRPRCAEMALEGVEPVLIENTLSTCGGCPLALWYGGKKAMAVGLRHGEKVYGLLTVSIPEGVTVGEEERSLLKEVAGDIAFALWALDLEEERRRSEEAYRSLVEHSLQGLAILQDGRVVFANSALAELSGYTVEELLALSPEEVQAVVHPDDRERVLQRMNDRLAGKEVPPRQEFRFFHKDGTVRWVETLASRVEYRGRPAIQVAYVDVTERKRVEEELRKSEEWHRLLLSSITDGCWVLDREWRYKLVNEAGARLVNMTPDQLLGRKLTELFPGVEKTEFFAAYSRSMWERTTEHVTAPFTHPDGRTGFYEVDVYPAPDGILCIGRDVTERKRVEERRARLVQRLSILHQVAQEVLQELVEPERVYEAVHRAVAELMPAEAFVIALRTGEREAEAVYLVDEGGHHPPESIPYGEGLTWYVLSTGRKVFVLDAAEGIPFRERRFGSKERSVRSILAVPLRVRERVIGMLSTQSYGPGAFTEEDLQTLEMLGAYVGVALENARLFSALRESEARFRRLAENAPDLIYRYRLRPEPGFEYVNPASTRIVGYTPEEHYADSELGMKIVHPEDRPVLEALRQGGEFFYRPLQFRWIHKDGHIVWAEQINIPVYDEKGELVAIEGIARDITERKKAEEERLRWAHAVEEVLYQLVNVLSSAIELRDPYTAGHQRRVAELACAIAKELRLSEEQMRGLRVAALLHDVGKILYVPIEILSKPARLTELEMALIREHSRVGYDILRKVDFPWPVAEIVYQHHERLNGSGYPRGLRGDEILLEARILAVADVVEAMSSHRPYRPAHPLEKALAEIRENAGKLYDPAVVEACLRVFQRDFKFSPSA
ncbi:MAG: PAS domain S-box protein [Candidatus Caldatribacterium sp.]|nr:PAS domain S-box protein [Candidatus Caldatribacterium sp.]